MPSVSPKQAKLMRAVAHGWKKPGGGGPSRAVATEFMHADEAKKKGKRSRVQIEGRKAHLDRWARNET